MALRSNRHDGRAWSSLGFAQLLEHDLAGARESFAAASRLIPSHVGTWHGAGWAALLQRDPAAAQRCFESALTLDRNFAESHGGLAVSLAMQGQEPSARASIDRAMRLDPGNLSARYARALLQGDVRDAGALRRLAERLLGDVPAPMGGTVLDLLACEPAAPARKADSADSE
jgi:Tfp pilus assembly protein PilF